MNLPSLQSSRHQEDTFSGGVGNTTTSGNYNFTNTTLLIPGPAPRSSKWKVEPSPRERDPTFLRQETKRLDSKSIREQAQQDLSSNQVARRRQWNSKLSEVSDDRDDDGSYHDNSNSNSSSNALNSNNSISINSINSDRQPRDDEGDGTKKSARKARKDKKGKFMETMKLPPMSESSPNEDGSFESGVGGNGNGGGNVSISGSGYVGSGGNTSGNANVNGKRMDKLLAPLDCRGLSDKQATEDTWLQPVGKESRKRQFDGTLECIEGKKERKGLLENQLKSINDHKEKVSELKTNKRFIIQPLECKTSRDDRDRGSKSRDPDTERIQSEW